MVMKPKHVGDTRKITTTDPLYPYYFWHPTFDDPNAEKLYPADGALPQADEGKENLNAAANNVTLQSMHYWLFRADRATDADARQRLLAVARRFRDHVVLGNFKAIYGVEYKFRQRDRDALELRSVFSLEMFRIVLRFDPWRGISFYSFLLNSLFLIGMTHRDKRHKDLLDRQLVTDMEVADFREFNDDLCSELMKRTLETVANDLCDSHRELIERRFGLNGRPPETTADIARDLGTTVSNISTKLWMAAKRIRKLTGPFIDSPKLKVMKRSKGEQEKLELAQAFADWDFTAGPS